MEALSDAATCVLVAVRRRLPRGVWERGAGLVEYALLVALIALVCIAAVTFVGKSTCSNATEAELSALGGSAPPSCN